MRLYFPGGTFQTHVVGHPVYAAISSGSLSLLATCIDSIFDPGSNLLLYWLHKKSKKLNLDQWPVGGARLETIGNIIYGEYWPPPSTLYSSSPIGFLYVFVLAFC